jgi:hypothetical protein
MAEQRQKWPELPAYGASRGKPDSVAVLRSKV